MINNAKGREQLDTAYMIIAHFRLRISGLQNVFFSNFGQRKSNK